MPRFDKSAYEQLLRGLSHRDLAEAIAIAEKVRDGSEAVTAFDAHASDGGPLADCPNCGSSDRKRWGKTRTSVQRWRCKDCGATWSGRTGTPAERTHHADRLLKLARNMMEETTPWSCREAARKLGVSTFTAWSWRIKIIHSLQPESPGTLTGTVEADEARRRESRKGSREWALFRANPENVDIVPVRKRWRDYRRGEAPPGGWQSWLLKFLAAANRDGRRAFEAIGDAGYDEISAPLLSVMAPDAILCTDGWATYGSIARDANIAHFALPKGRREKGMPESAHINTVNSQIARFRTFLKPFRGPASKFRRAYGRWFAARDNADRDFGSVFSMFLCAG